MKIKQSASLLITSIALSACSATNPGLFKTSQPLTLEHSEIQNNLGLSFDQFMNQWLPLGAVNQTVQQIAKVISYGSTNRNTSGLKAGERLESYAATDSAGNDREIINKLNATFQAWCSHHAGQIGTPDRQRSAYIYNVLESSNSSPSESYYDAYVGASNAKSCTKNGQVIATLAYSQGNVRGLSSNYTFPSVLIFVKDWSK